MGVKRTKIKAKDASYLMFGGSGGGGSSGSNKTIGMVGGHGGSGLSIQLAMQKEKDRKKQEIKNQLKDYKRQLEIKEEIKKQEAKIDAEIKETEKSQFLSSKVWDTHTQNISDPKFRNIFKDGDTKHRLYLCDIIAREERDNPKEDNFVIKIIKNIGKKKPPKNITIVQ